MPVQPLRFNICVVRSAADLRAACEVRARSYGHHLPQLRHALAEPDELDWHPDTAVLLARDKTTHEAVGTARLSTNARGRLQIERSVPLPALLGPHLLAEVTRLSVLPGHDDPRVKLALMKGTYLYAMAHQVQWMVIGARSDALVRQYRRLGFTDLLGDGRSVALAHAGDLQHHVLGFEVTAAERNWHAAQHPLYDFMVRTHHPDIQLFGPALSPPPEVAQPAALAARRSSSRERHLRREARAHRVQQLEFSEGFADETIHPGLLAPHPILPRGVRRQGHDRHAGQPL
jgi:hypothetical protein